MKINTKRFIKLSETIDGLIAFGRADKAKKLMDKLKIRRGPAKALTQEDIIKGKGLRIRRGPYRPKESPFLKQTPRSYGFSEPKWDEQLSEYIKNEKNILGAKVKTGGKTIIKIQRKKPHVLKRLRKRIFGFSDPTLDQALEGHAEKHSKSHMAEMKRQMAQGKSFKEAHMIAMRKVGR